MLYDEEPGQYDFGPGHPFRGDRYTEKAGPMKALPLTEGEVNSEVNNRLG